LKIRQVTHNNRRKAFEVTTQRGSYVYPYARLAVKPTSHNVIKDVYVDRELGNEAFTYVLEAGEEGTVHIDHVLDYNQDPTYLRDMLLYRLTLEAQKRVEKSALSKREIIRRLGTSASQFYRLLDQTNTTKSIGQLLGLLDVLGCDVDVRVKDRARAKVS
jgi:predicted XRE-type DNA-binding protein